MRNSTRFGRSLFGVGMLGFGGLNLVFALPVRGLEPWWDGWPMRPLWAYVTGLVLVLAGLCLISNRLRPRQAAIALASLLSLWLLLQLPTLTLNVGDGGAWTCAFECLALCGASWVLVDALADGVDGSIRHDLFHRLATLGRYGFGISLPVFGALHFIYHDYVASVIPAWVPGSPVFWTYFTGCAHIAAGLAVLAGVQARLATRLLGVMFGSWVLIVHIPRVLARPDSQAEWTSLCVATALTGGAWLMAGYFSRALSEKDRQRFRVATTVTSSQMPVQSRIDPRGWSAEGE